MPRGEGTGVGGAGVAGLGVAGRFIAPFAKAAACCWLRTSRSPL